MNVHSRAPSPILTLAYWNKIDCSMTELTKFWNSLSRILSPSDREVSGVQRFAKNLSLRGSTSSKFIKWIMHTRTMYRSRYWHFESHLFLVDAFDMEWCVVYNIVALLNVYIFWCSSSGRVFNMHGLQNQDQKYYLFNLCRA